MLMVITCWIALGLVAGFFAAATINGRDEGPSLDIFLGIVGAVVGGWLFNAFRTHGATGFSAWSLCVAMAGAVALLLVWHIIRGRPAHA